MSAETSKDENPSGIPSSYKAALIIFAAVVLYFGIGPFLNASGGDATEEVVESRPPFTVLVRDIEVEDRSLTLRMAARTEAGRRIIVRAETPGQVVALRAEEGDTVQSGDVLCQLDVDSRRAVTAEAQAALSKANSDYEAAVRLHKEGFTSDAALRTATAARDAARARLSQAQQDLQNVQVTAPFDGLVAQTLVDPGDVIAAGGPCAVLADLSEIVIAGGVPARDAARLAPGDTAMVQIEDRKPIAARVTFVSDVADDQTRAFRVELSTNGASGIPVGLNAVATINAETSTTAFVPRNVLVFNDQGALGVRIVEPAQDDLFRVRFHPVTLVGEENDGAYVSGLSGTTPVIIRGQDYVSDGSMVDIAREGFTG